MQSAFYTDLRGGNAPPKITKISPRGDIFGPLQIVPCITSFRPLLTENLITYHFYSHWWHSYTHLSWWIYCQTIPWYSLSSFFMFNHNLTKINFSSHQNPILAIGKTGSIEAFKNWNSVDFGDFCFRTETWRLYSILSTTNYIISLCSCKFNFS